MYACMQQQRAMQAAVVEKVIGQCIQGQTWQGNPSLFNNTPTIVIQIKIPIYTYLIITPQA